MDRRLLERWLAAEEGGQDDAADAEFATLFAAVRKVEPTPDFVEQTVTAAWRWRVRRRRLVMLGSAAAILLVAGAAMVGYGVAPQLATSMIKALALVSGRAVPWLVAYATVAVDWWWTVGRVGGVVAAALITPARVVAVVGVELVGILAFYALQRIAGAERLGDAQV